MPCRTTGGSKPITQGACLGPHSIWRETQTLRESWLETDLQRFPSWGTILDWMVTVDFETVEWRLVQRILDHKVGREVLRDLFLQKDACSQLALLSDEAYMARLRRIEAAAEEAAAAGETVTFPVEIHLSALMGRSPSKRRT